MLVGLLLWSGASSTVQAFSIPLSKKQSLTFDMTLTSVFHYYHPVFLLSKNYNPAQDRPAHSVEYMGLYNKLDLSAAVENYRAGVRVDTVTFFNDRVSCPDDRPSCKGDYRPEKIYLKIRQGNFDFVGGDFYLTLGRGIALSIRKDDEFGLDTTLRGARVSYEDGPLHVTVAGGFVNNNNYDMVPDAILPEDVNDLIFASRLSRRFFELVTVGAHYVYRSPFPRPDKGLCGSERCTSVEWMHIIGGSLEAGRFFDRVDLYFEGNAFVDRFLTKDDLGGALYGSINGYFFPVTLLLEGQWYKNYKLSALSFSEQGVLVPLFVYPPTMEYRELDKEGDNTNVWGGRIRVDYTLPWRTTILFANYMARLRPGDKEGEFDQVHHVYGGVEHRFGHWGQLNLSGGGRESYYWRVPVHVEGDFTVHFASRHALKLVGRYSWNEKGHNEPTPESRYNFHILDVQIGYTFSGIGSLSLLYSYSEENFVAGKITPRHFLAAELKILFSRYGFIKFYAGSSRGGLRCISGICRIFPDNYGFRTELGLRL